MSASWTEAIQEASSRLTGGLTIGSITEGTIHKYYNIDGQLFSATLCVMALGYQNDPRTAQDIAAAELRAAIVRGDLAPGAKIRQEASARQIGVSLIPIREALKVLSGEGLVTYVPQRGYFVTRLEDDAIRQIYDARSLVESEVERLAVGRLGAEQLTAMREALRSQEHAVEDRDPVRMIAGNRAFHFALFGACENPWLVGFVTQLWDAIDSYRVVSYRRMWLESDAELIPGEILAEHRRILDALAGGHSQLALELLRRHRGHSESFLTALVMPSADRDAAQLQAEADRGSAARSRSG
jgi:DNA-binding GntR family transcriptional regulator